MKIKGHGCSQEAFQRMPDACTARQSTSSVCAISMHGRCMQAPVCARCLPVSSGSCHHCSTKEEGLPLPTWSVRLTRAIFFVVSPLAYPQAAANLLALAFCQTHQRVELLGLQIRQPEPGFEGFVGLHTTHVHADYPPSQKPCQEAVPMTGTSPFSPRRASSSKSVGLPRRRVEI